MQLLAIINDPKVGSQDFAIPAFQTLLMPEQSIYHHQDVNFKFSFCSYFRANIELLHILWEDNAK